MLHQRSDAVVVGGGIMGAAALHYLAERGCERPMLLERDHARFRLDRSLRQRRSCALLR
jgi:glycine/D-amino acid oxidase-like deaminating enzyme